MLDDQLSDKNASAHSSNEDEGDVATIANPADDHQTNEQTPKMEPEKANHHAQSSAHGDKPVQNIIIIKRIKKHVNKHHGGSWKIAYADFVTAMMTFFLLLWLLSMLNKSQLAGISNYFKRPIKNLTADKTDPHNDKIKVENPSTSNKIPKIDDAAQSSNPEKPKPDEMQNRKASESIKEDLENQMKSNPKISQYKNMLNFKVTSQGLKIEMKDLENKPMFSSGKTNFEDYAVEILDWLATAVNKYPNRVMIVGHTDSKPIQGSEDYTNWELSSDRSNATRRVLIDHGMEDKKIVRIVGAADTDKLESAKTTDDPSNRRIAIIVLTDEAYKKMQDE